AAHRARCGSAMLGNGRFGHRAPCYHRAVHVPVSQRTTTRRTVACPFACALLSVMTAAAVVAAPARPALDPAAARWVEQTLKSMSMDEKIGQLLVTSLNATFTSADSDTFDKLRHLVRDVRVGGIHVFGGTEPMPALMLNPNYGNGGG